MTCSSNVIELLEKGQDERHVGSTDWNERSSRSHTVLTLTIESRSRERKKVDKNGDEDGDGEEEGVRISQLNLIDLAGSERAASQKERRKEGAFVSISGRRGEGSTLVGSRNQLWENRTLYLLVLPPLPFLLSDQQISSHSRNCHCQANRTFNLFRSSYSI